MTPDQVIQFFCTAALHHYPLARHQEYEMARQVLMKALMNDLAQQNIAAAKQAADGPVTTDAAPAQ